MTNIQERCAVIMYIHSLLLGKPEILMEELNSDGSVKCYNAEKVMV